MYCESVIVFVCVKVSVRARVCVCLCVCVFGGVCDLLCVLCVCVDVI